MNINKLPDSELLIMTIIWDYDGDPDLMTVTAQAKERYGKEWKLQTVATFMTRLKNREFINIYRIGRYSHYQAVITEEEYKQFTINETYSLLFKNNAKEMAKSVSAAVVRKLKKEVCNKPLNSNEEWSKVLRERMDLTDMEKQLIHEAFEQEMNPEKIIKELDTERTNICCHTSLMYGDIDHICSAVSEKFLNKKFESDNMEYVNGPDDIHKSREEIITCINNEKKQWSICGFSSAEIESLLHTLLLI